MAEPTRHRKRFNTTLNPKTIDLLHRQARGRDLPVGRLIDQLVNEEQNRKYDRDAAARGIGKDNQNSA